VFSALGRRMAVATDVVFSHWAEVVPAHRGRRIHGLLFAARDAYFRPRGGRIVVGVCARRNRASLRALRRDGAVVVGCVGQLAVLSLIVWDTPWPPRVSRRLTRSTARSRYNPAMQIRLTRDVEAQVRASSPLSVDRFLARFPEVPRDLRDEPILTQFVRAFGPQLDVAEKPSPCVARDGGGDAPHHFYTRLVNDLAIYGVGLAKRDRTLQRLERLLAEYRAQPATFACTLVPRKAPGAPRPQCG